MTYTEAQEILDFYFRELDQNEVNTLTMEGVSTLDEIKAQPRSKQIEVAEEIKEQMRQEVAYLM